MSEDRRTGASLGRRGFPECRRRDAVHRQAVVRIDIEGQLGTLVGKPLRLRRRVDSGNERHDTVEIATIVRECGKSTRPWSTCRARTAVHAASHSPTLIPADPPAGTGVAMNISDNRPRAMDITTSIMVT